METRTNAETQGRWEGGAEGERRSTAAAPARIEPRDEILPATLPGSPERAAAEVAQVSVEGRPAAGDAKSGPGRVCTQIALAALVALALAAAIGWWFGPIAGVVTLVIAAAGLAFNPVMGAAAMRVGDRAEVIEKHGH